MKKNIFIISLFVLILQHANAQNGFENFFLAEKQDANKLLNGYFSPRIKGYLNALNSNWYHTAKVHKPFGFDFSINLNSVIYPSSSNQFNISGLKSINPPSGSITSASYIGNETTNTANIATRINNENATAIIGLPTGENSSFLSNSNLPIAQLNVGVSNGFEINIRLLPAVKPNNENESLNVFGIGLKKEITNWFSSLKDSPLHIALLTSYCNMSVNYGIKNSNLPNGNTSGIAVTNGFTEFNLNTYTFQTLASYHFMHVDVFGGIAYNTGNATYKTFGDFEGKYITNTETITKELDTSNTLAFNTNNISATLGGRLNLRYFKIFTSYTLQEFSTFNIGASISIR